MTSKFDECVQAVCAAAGKRPCLYPRCHCDYINSFERDVRAVLATLREPNEAMLMAAGRECGKIEPDRLRRFGIPIQAVQAMLDTVETEEG